MKQFAVLILAALTFGVAGCTTAVDTEPVVDGSGTGIFLTVVSIDGTPISGSVAASQLDADRQNVGFEATIDTAGRTFLPLTAGEWDFVVSNKKGEVLDCDKIDGLIYAEGISAETLTCNNLPLGEGQR